MVLSNEILHYIDCSVLCWLATADARGQPNVSPKEVFAAVGVQHIAIANMASPTSVRNILENPQVCVSFIDVFVQKGYKIIGNAHILYRDSPRYDDCICLLEQITQGAFPIHNIILCKAERVEPIVAPSYRIRSDVTEQNQVAATMKRYNVRPSSCDK